MVIDDYQWHTMKDVTIPVITDFKNALRAGKTVGIISEAGCPGVADPGQKLVLIAQSLNVPVRPLVGPSSILLALMASGMNGQQFQFVGYLPIDSTLRIQAIKSIEAESKQKNCTQIFIETPYRNNQLAETLVRTCKSETLLCIAAELTSEQEFIKTKPPVIALFVECFYYGSSMLDYSLERHKLTHAQSVRYIGLHKGLAIGNGLVFFLMHLILIVGWVLAPAYAVIAATLSLHKEKNS
jgi:hypothetical protein